MAISKPTPSSSGGAQTDVLAAFAAAGGSGAATQGRVYFGEQGGYRPKGAEEKGRLLPKRSVWLTEDEAISRFFGWRQKDQQDFLAKGIVSGLLKLGDGPMEASKLWTKLVKEAASYGKAGKKVHPFDILASYVSAAGGTRESQWQSMGAFEVNVATGEKRYVGPGTYLGDGKAQQIDTRTDLTDPDTARAIATKLFQDLMGRDPGAGELGAFASALHTAESSAPVVNTTTTTYNMETGQPVSQDTQSSGGMTAEGRALIGENQIKKSKEYGVTQAATTYQNAFENLIFGAPE
ncbi:hypothetical protein [Streptomyces sp. t39]|uniref:hypothetical protein n=1 Tax=Streptomyces sp. t39 TaxID=1828156 RepID=UPI0011CE8BBE|nr:hypothetical protein [Streptomyces sp. t39]TXS35064.1 hypothetical protein EAO77_37855 [Streptomyces sp. t39]